MNLTIEQQWVMVQACGWMLIGAIVALAFFLTYIHRNTKRW